MKYKIYPKGTVCLVCGMGKEEVKQDKIKCKAWGKAHYRHTWNKEPLKINEKHLP